jgi:hypothetical protein
MAIFITCVIGFFIYFLPAFVAGRNHKRSDSIFLLNLLLGWTFIGWVVALIWAFARDDEKKNPAPVINKSITDELIKLNELKSNGAISESEFDTLKAKIIK